MLTQTDAPSCEHSIDRFIAARRASDPKFSKTSFAELVGVSRGAIYRVIRGSDEVSTDLFEKIERATDGALTAINLFAEWHAVRESARKAAANAVSAET